MIKDKICNFFYKSVYWMLGLFFFSCIIVNFFVFAYSKPKPGFLKYTWDLTLVCLASLVVLVIFYYLLFKLAHKLKNISQKKFEIITIILFILAQVAFVLMFPFNSRSDSRTIQKYSMLFLSGDNSVFDPGRYLGLYPNNVGITIYTSLLYSLFPRYLFVIRFFNILFTTAAVYFSYRLYRLIKNCPEVYYRFFLLILVTCPVLIAMNNYCYGDVPSASCAIIGLYFAMTFVKHKKWRDLILSIIILTIGMFLRSSALLFILAIVIYYFYKMLRERDFYFKSVIGIVLTGFIAINPLLIVFESYALNTGIIKEPMSKYSHSTIRWINMGYPEEELLGYHDGGYSTHIFRHILNNNPELAKKFFLREYIHKLKTNPPLVTLKNYYKKTYWNWTEGSYQLRYYAFSEPSLIEYELLYETPLAKPLKDRHAPLRKALTVFLHVRNIIVLFFVVAGLAAGLKRKRDNFLLPVLVILLFVGFYVFWELKSRYIFPTHYLLVLLSAPALSALLDKLIMFRRKSSY